MRGLAYHPEGWMATAGQDGTVRLWDADGRVFRTLAGPSEGMLSVAVSREGLVAAGGQSGAIRVWSSRDGRMLTQFKSGIQSANAVAFSADGKRLAGVNHDGTVMVWTLPDWKPVRLAEPYDQTELLKRIFRKPGDEGADTHGLADDAAVGGAAFSPEGLLLAAGAGETAGLWDLATNDKRFDLERPSGRILSLAFSPDGRRIAGGCSDKTVRVWDAETGRLTATVDAHELDVTAVAFHPDGRRLASGDLQGVVRLHDTSEWKTSPPIRNPDFRHVYALAFSHDGTRLASGHTQGAVELWNVSDWTRLRAKTPNVSWPEAVASDAPGRWLAVGSRDNTVSLWETATGMELSRLADTPDKAKFVSDVRAALGAAPGYASGSFMQVAFGRDGRSLLAGGWGDATVRIWDLDRGGGPLRVGEPGSADRPLSHGVTSLALSPDGSRLASIHLADRTVSVWSLGDGTKLSSFALEDTGNPLKTGDLGFATDGSLLTVTDAGTIDRRAPGMEAPARVPLAAEPLRAIPEIRFLEQQTRHLPKARAFSPDGEKLAVATFTGSVRVFDTRTGRQTAVLGRGELDTSARVLAVAFDPDGRRLAIAPADGTVRLWDVAAGRLLRTFEGHAGVVVGLAFDAAGQRLYSAARDATVRIWDTHTGDELAALVSLPDTGGWLAVTPDGLFDGSPEAWKRILWRFGGRTFDTAPVEIFFREFWYPGLLAELMAGNRPAAPRNLAAIDRRQPAVSVALAAGDGRPGAGAAGAEVAERLLRVVVDVSEAPPDADHAAGSGARDVRLFRNGSLVRTWHGDVLAGRRSVKLTATVPIVAGENRLTAYAFSSENIKSPDAELAVTGAGSLRRKGTATVLAVGVADYSRQPDPDLLFAASDARAMGETLGSLQRKLGTFDTVRTAVLADGEATRRNILAALALLAGDRVDVTGLPAPVRELTAAQPEDAVFVFLSGHGLRRAETFRFVPAEGEHITDEELRTAFGLIDARGAALIIDACNSGEALEAKEPGDTAGAPDARDRLRRQLDVRGPINSRGLAQLAYEKGMFVLAASQSTQVARESTESRRGYLAHALLEGVTTFAADAAPADGAVTIREWFDYAVERVPRLQGTGTQRTVIIKGDAAGGVQRPKAYYRREAGTDVPVVARSGG